MGPRHPSEHACWQGHALRTYGKTELANFVPKVLACCTSDLGHLRFNVLCWMVDLLGSLSVQGPWLTWIDRSDHVVAKISQPKIFETYSISVNAVVSALRPFAEQLLLPAAAENLQDSSPGVEWELETEKSLRPSTR